MDSNQRQLVMERMDAIDKELDRLTRQKMAANGNCQYGEALKLVACENAPLAREREQIQGRLLGTARHTS
jgi:hypothetical protein